MTPGQRADASYSTVCIDSVESFGGPYGRVSTSLSDAIRVRWAPVSPHLAKKKGDARSAALFGSDLGGWGLGFDGSPWLLVAL
jgi:hypothetical protein